MSLKENEYIVNNNNNKNNKNNNIKDILDTFVFFILTAITITLAVYAESYNNSVITYTNIDHSSVKEDILIWGNSFIFLFFYFSLSFVFTDLISSFFSHFKSDNNKKPGLLDIFIFFIVLNILIIIKVIYI